MSSSGTCWGDIFLIGLIYSQADCMDPTLLRHVVAEDTHQKLRYARVCIAGVGVCAMGRWAHSGSVLPALTDALACVVGACTSLESCGAPEARLDFVSTTCLFPFVMLAGINSVFDTLTLILVCRACFECAMFAESTACTGCFFTFSAAVFQALGCFLSWSVYKSYAVAANDYGLVEDMQELMPCLAAQGTPCCAMQDATLEEGMHERIYVPASHGSVSRDPEVKVVEFSNARGDLALSFGPQHVFGDGL